MIRPWSEDNPTIISSSRTRRFGDLTRPILETILYWKIQPFALRLSSKISRNAAPATKSTAASPNSAPGTKTHCHDSSASHTNMKRHLQCAEQHESATKYCACHAKWLSWLIRVTYERSFRMRGASKVTLQTHQVLRMPRNSEFKISAQKPWIASANTKTIRPWSEDHPSMKWSSRTRRFGDLTRPILEMHFVWKNTTLRAPAIFQNFRKCCACHEKWLQLHQIILRLPRKLTWHPFSPGIYSPLASILSWHLFSLGIYSL